MKETTLVCLESAQQSIPHHFCVFNEIKVEKTPLVFVFMLAMGVDLRSKRKLS